MMRWDIINHLIRVNNYKSYLEIGYYKGWSFDRVLAGSFHRDFTRMDAVDPNPSKWSMETSWEYGSSNDISDYYDGQRHVIHKMTSDEFFAKDMGRKWDIIFIDGLHKSEQVDRDIQNALKHLNPGGTIVMHDCNPSTEEMTTTGVPATGEWTGDVYKSFIRYRVESEGYCYVVDTDYGVGIIHPNQEMGVGLRNQWLNTDWATFDEHRKVLLQLTSIEDFLKIETNETTTDNNVPTQR